MKTGKKILIAILAMLCVAAAVVGIVGCNNKTPTTQPETKYDAIYNAYVEVLNEEGEDAMGHDEWYDAYMSSIDAAQIGEDFEIEEYFFVTDNSADYVEYVFTNGKIYRLSLAGNNFIEYVVFTINTKDDEGASLGGVNLDIYNVSNGSVWRTIQTGAQTYSFKLYVPAKDPNTYGIKVSSVNDHNHTFGIPVGDEPTFTVSSAKTIEVELSTPIVYMVRTTNTLDIPIGGVAVGIYYNDEDNTAEIASGVTGNTGTLTVYLVVKPGSHYIVKFQDVEDAIPFGFYCNNEEFELDFEYNITTIQLLKHISYIDHVVTDYATEIAQEQDGDVKYDPEPVALNAGAALEKLANGTYTLDGRAVYVALDMLVERVHAEKSIFEIVNEEESEIFFAGLALHYEEGQTDEEAAVENVFDRFSYVDMLKAYGAKVNAEGLYLLNDDLLAFVKNCAYLFAGATGAETDWMLPLMQYEGPKLAPGTDGQLEGVRMPGTNSAGVTISVGLKRNITAGYYVIIAHSNSALNYLAFGSGSYNTSYRLTNMTDKTVGDNSKYTYNYGYYLYIDSSITSVSYVNEWGNYTFTLELVFLSDVQLPEQITESGEYVLPIIPNTYTRGSITNNTFNDSLGTKLLQRGYYSYTIEVLEWPAVYEGEELSTEITSVSYAKLHYTGSTTSSNITLTKTGTSSNDGNITSSSVTAANTPRILFYYATSTYGNLGVLTIKVRLTLALTRVNITYDKGVTEEDEVPVTGTTASQSNQVVGATITLKDNGFKKEGYVFAGWQDEEGNVYEGGASFVVPGHDVKLTALWAKEVIKEVENLGTEKDLTVELDPEKYTTVTIGFDKDVEAGAYVLTLDFGADYLGAKLVATLGSKTVHLVYSSELSTGEHNIYLGYLYIESHEEQVEVEGEGEGEEPEEPVTVTVFDKLTLSITIFEKAYTAKFTLKAYEPVALKLDKDSEVAFNYYGKDVFTFVFDETVQPSTAYRIVITNISDVAMGIWFYNGTAQLFSTGTVAAGGVYAYSYTTPESLEDMVLHVRASSSSSYGWYSVVGIKIASTFSVTYDFNDNGDPERTGTLPTVSPNLRAEGEQITISTTKPVRPDYEFMGWSADPDFEEYDPEETYLQGNDIFVMPYKAVVFKAVWRSLVYFETEIGAGSANKATVEFDSAKYEGTRVTLKDGTSAGAYNITLESDTALGETITYNTGRNAFGRLTFKEYSMSTGKYVYTGTVVIAEAKPFLHFNITTEKTVNATVTLEEYTKKALKAGEEVDVIINAYGATGDYISKFALDASVDAANYQIKIERGDKDSVSINLWFVDADGATVGSSTSLSLSSNSSAWSTGYTVTVPAGATGFYLIWSSGSYRFYAGGYSISVTRLYSITFTSGAEDATGTAPAAYTNLVPGAVRTVRKNTFSRAGYVFAGWTIQGDETNKVYKYGDAVTIKNSDIIFVAKWEQDSGSGSAGPVSKEITFGTEVTAELAEANKYSVEFKLPAVEATGNYTITFKSTVDLGNFITSTAGTTLVVMTKDTTNSTDTEFVYTGYSSITATTGIITFNAGVATTIKATVTEYATINIVVNGDAVVLPMVGSNFNFKITGDYKVGGTYYFVYTNSYSGNGYIAFKSSNNLVAQMGTISKDATSAMKIKGTGNNDALVAADIQAVWYLYAMNTSASYPASRDRAPMMVRVVSTRTVSYATGVSADDDAPVTGNVPSSTTNYIGYKMTLNAGTGLKREGYTFKGWMESETNQIYAGSSSYVIPDHNVTFTAVWQKNSIVTVNDMLSLGSEGKVTLNLTSGTTGAVVVVDTDEVTAGQYFVKVTATGNLGNYFILTTQGVSTSNSALTYTVYMVKDPANTSATSYNYIGAVYLAKIDEITFTYDCSSKPLAEAIDMTIQLDEYELPELKADGEIHYLFTSPYTAKNLETENRLSFTLDDALYGADYKVYFHDITGIMNAYYMYNGTSLMAGIGSAANFLVGTGITFPAKDAITTPQVQTYPSGVGGSSESTFVMVGVKLAKAYKVTYANGAGEGDTVSGSVTDTNYYVAGEYATVKSNSFIMRKDGLTYEFLHWTYNDNKYYYNDTVEVVEGGITFTATWRLQVIDIVEKTLGTEEAVTLKLDSTKYSRTQLPLAVLAAGDYTIRVDFGAKDPGWSRISFINDSRNFYLVYDEAASSDTHHIYYGVISITSSTTAQTLWFYTRDVDYGEYDISVSLQAYEAPVITFGVDEPAELTLVISFSTYFIQYQPASTIIAGDYEITVTDLSGKLADHGTTGYIYDNSTSTTYRTQFTFGEAFKFSRRTDGGYFGFSMGNDYCSMIKVTIRLITE